VKTAVFYFFSLLNSKQFTDIIVNNTIFLNLLMTDFNFDDTQTSGIWWSTNVSIRDLCVELKEDTSCSNSELVEFLRSIANSIELNGF